MDWLTDALGELNYWSILLAAISTLIVGAIWYAEGVFGKAWMKEAGLTKKDIEEKEGMGLKFGLTFVFSLVAATGLGVLIYLTNTTDALEALALGGLVGLAFTALPNAVQNLFGKKSYLLSAIQGGDIVVRTAVMAIIIALMA